MLYKCKQCGARLNIPDERLKPEGSRFKCTKCGAVLLVKKPAVEIAKFAEAAPVKPLGAVKRGKRINPHLFTFPFWGGLVVIMAGGIMRAAGSDAGAILVFAGLGGIIFGLIYHLIALYRCWSVIPSAIARTTPRKAVGYLFIPFFNLYWIFVAVRGLAVDANEFMDQTVVSEKRISEGLSIAYCIIALLSIIVLTLFFTFIMLNILVYQWARFNNGVVAAPASAFQKPPHPYPRTQRKTNEATVIAVVIGVIIAGMVAVAVIGILAAIAIPAFLGQREKARMRALEENYNTAISIVREELRRCDTDRDSVTTDVVAQLNAGDMFNPWFPESKPFSSSFGEGQVAISHSDLRSICGTDAEVVIRADNRGDGIEDGEFEESIRVSGPEESTFDLPRLEHRSTTSLEQTNL